MKKFTLLFFTAFLLFAFTGCTSKTQEPAQQTEIVISAASSLTDALNEAKKEFEAEHPEMKITYNFGSSGTLVQQIQSGAPTDLFIAASKKYMDDLEKKDLTDKNTRFNLASNEIVLIGGKDKSTTVNSFQGLAQLQDKKLAIGDPNSVPAGKYGEEVLQHFNVLETAKKSFVMGSSVRQVLTYVESGNAEFGLVFASDALVSSKVKVLATSEPGWHSEIQYPCSMIKATNHKEEVNAFISFLKGEKGKGILKKYGFKL